MDMLFSPGDEAVTTGPWSGLERPRAEQETGSFPFLTRQGGSSAGAGSVTTWELPASPPRRGGEQRGRGVPCLSASPRPAGRAGGSRSGGQGEEPRAGPGRGTWAGAPGPAHLGGVASALQGSQPRAAGAPPPHPLSRSPCRATGAHQPRSPLPPGSGCLFRRLCSLCPERPLPAARSVLPGLSPHHIPRPHTCSASRRHRHPDSRAGTAAAILEAGAGGAGRRVTGRGRRDAGSERRAARGGASPHGAGRRVTGSTSGPTRGRARAPRGGADLGAG